MYIKNKIRDNSGSAMNMSLIVIIIVSIFSIMLFNQVSNQFKSNNNINSETEVKYASEAIGESIIAETGRQITEGYESLENKPKSKSNFTAEENRDLYLVSNIDNAIKNLENIKSNKEEIKKIIADLQEVLKLGSELNESNIQEIYKRIGTNGTTSKTYDYELAFPFTEKEKTYEEYTDCINKKMDNINKIISEPDRSDFDKAQYNINLAYYTAILMSSHKHPAIEGNDLDSYIKVFIELSITAPTLEGVKQNGYSKAEHFQCRISSPCKVGGDYNDNGHNHYKNYSHHESPGNSNDKKHEHYKENSRINIASTIMCATLDGTPKETVEFLKIESIKSINEVIDEMTDYQIEIFNNTPNLSTDQAAIEALELAKYKLIEAKCRLGNVNYGGDKVDPPETETPETETPKPPETGNGKIKVDIPKDDFKEMFKDNSQYENIKTYNDEVKFELDVKYNINADGSNTILEVESKEIDFKTNVNNTLKNSSYTLKAKVLFGYDVEKDKFVYEIKDWKKR